MTQGLQKTRTSMTVWRTSWRGKSRSFLEEATLTWDQSIVRINSMMVWNGIPKGGKDSFKAFRDRTEWWSNSHIGYRMRNKSRWAKLGECIVSTQQAYGHTWELFSLCPGRVTAIPQHGGKKWPLSLPPCLKCCSGRRKEWAFAWKDAQED